MPAERFATRAAPIRAAALLELAAQADGTACASVDASSTGGNTTVGVTVTIEVCAEVTAVTDDSRICSWAAARGREGHPKASAAANWLRM